MRATFIDNAIIRLRQPRTSTLIVLCAFGVLYALSTKLEMWFFNSAGPLAAVWPSSGLGFAATWVWGRKMLPVIFTAEALFGTGSFPPWFSLLAATGNTLTIFAAYEFIKKYKSEGTLFDSPRNVVLFILAGAFGQGTLCALTDVLRLYVGGTISNEALASTWWICFLSNTTGTLAVAPFCVELFRQGFKPVNRHQLIEAVFIFCAVCIVCSLIFSKFLLPTLSVHPELFLLIPVLLCAIFRLESRLAFGALAIAGLFAPIATALGQKFSDPSVVKSLLLVEVNLIVLSLTILIIAPLLTQRGKGIDDLKQAQDMTIFALVSAAKIRSGESDYHLLRTQRFVAMLADDLRKHPRFRSQLRGRKRELLIKSTPLHDIGKVGVPDAILKKDTPLTREEFEQIKMHTVHGRDALTGASSMLGGNSFLRLAEDIIYTHHERWDGRGYPQGLKEDEIPVAGRLMALADAYDALTQYRVYKQCCSHESAISIILKERGKAFDPDVVDAFMRRQEAFAKIKNSLPDPCDSDERKDSSRPESDFKDHQTSSQPPLLTT